MKQQTFEALNLDENTPFGGTLLKGNARTQRPIFLRKPLHLVMRSEHATGKFSFLEAQRAKAIDRILDKQAQRFNIKIFRRANSGNHLHLIILPRSREGYTGFIKAVTGLIARLTLGAERGAQKDIKFWDAKPFTRVIHWGEDFNRVKRYLLRNTLEAFGFLPLRKQNQKDFQPRWVSMKTLEILSSA